MITTIIYVILYLIPTTIGAIFRSIQVYFYNDSEKITTGNVILCVISFLFYILGFCMTNSERKKESCVPEERWSANISYILSIAIPVFFWFYAPAGMVIGKFMIGLLEHLLLLLFAVGVIVFIIMVIIGMISEGVDSVDSSPSPDFSDDEDKPESSYDIWRREEIEREKYVRNNWNSSYGRLNSDATMYQTPDGNWNKISSDGKRYEDDNGNWHTL